MHHASPSGSPLIGSGLRPLRRALLLLALGALGCEQWSGVHGVYIQTSHQATLDHWPLHSLQEALLQASLHDEGAHLRGFLPPRAAGKRAD